MFFSNCITNVGPAVMVVLFLVLYNRVLSYRSVKAAELVVEVLGTLFATSLYEVWGITEVCCPGIAIFFAIYMTETS